MIYNIVLISVGLILSIILYFRFPLLAKKENIEGKYKVSVIIPARNEEKTLPFLLSDLNNTDMILHEVICVNDSSTDNTKQVILDNNCILIEVSDKPDNWLGKSWACQKGAESATGDILLFLDADVRINKQGIAKLISQYDRDKSVISVQPYHKMEKIYEQLSFFFNIVAIGGNGAAYAFKDGSAGLFGPVILISKKDYIASGGHHGAKEFILEDLAIGQVLRARGIKYKLFVGEKDISFRMYGQNIQQIIEGWTKNYASGASMAKPVIFLMTFLWVTSLCATAVNFITSWVSFEPVKIMIFTTFYIIWIFELIRISKKIGNFSVLTCIFYPVFMLFFVMVFLFSVFKKIFKIRVTWKGRKI